MPAAIGRRVRRRRLQRGRRARRRRRALPGDRPARRRAGRHRHRRPLDQPAVTLLRIDDPLLAGSTSPTSASPTAQRRRRPAGRPAASPPRAAPLLLTGSTPAGRRRRALRVPRRSPSPTRTSRCRWSFPLLGDRLLTELAGTAHAASTASTSATRCRSTGGSDARVTHAGRPADAIVAIGAPAPTRRPCRVLGDARAAARRGWSRSTRRRPSRCSLRPTSSIKPAAARGDRRRTRRPNAALDRRWVIGALLVVLLLELLLARRARSASAAASGGSRSAARGRSPPCCSLRCFAPVVRRAADRVATVFVLDGSDSLGAAGTAEATRLGRARPSQHGRRRSRRGGGLRRRSPARPAAGGERRRSTCRTVVVDPSADQPRSAPCGWPTRCCPAMPAAGVVLVSDGRATTGDTSTEAAGAGRARHPDRRPPHRTGDRHRCRRDRRIDGPSLARVGESVTITASVAATAAGPAERGAATRRHGGRPPGRSHWSPAPTRSRSPTSPPTEAGSVLRYQVTVDQAGDVQVENDSGVRGGAGRRPGSGAARRGHRGRGRRPSAAALRGRRPGNRGRSRPASCPMPRRSRPTPSSCSSTSMRGSSRAISLQALDDGRARSRPRSGHGRGRAQLRRRRLPRHAARGPAPGDQRDPRPEAPQDRRRGALDRRQRLDGELPLRRRRDTPPARIGGGVNKTDISRAAAARTVEALSGERRDRDPRLERGVEVDRRPPTAPGRRRRGGGAPHAQAGRQHQPRRLARPRRPMPLRGSKAEPEAHHPVLRRLHRPVASSRTSPIRPAELYDDDGITVSVSPPARARHRRWRTSPSSGHGRFYPGATSSRCPRSSPRKR